MQQDIPIAQKVIKETGKELEAIKASLNPDGKGLLLIEKFKRTIIRIDIQAWLEHAQKIQQQVNN